MNLEQYHSLAKQGYNRIPVYRELLADFDTPLTIYQKLVDGDYAYLFESMNGGEQWGRYSIIGLPCKTRYQFSDGKWSHYEYNHLVAKNTSVDLITEIKNIQKQFNTPTLDELPKFTGGLVGYFGYEFTQSIEAKLKNETQQKDALQIPCIQLMLSEEVAVLDNLTSKLYLIINTDPSENNAWEYAQRRLQQLTHRLYAGGISYPFAIAPELLAEDNFISNFSQAEFMQAVEKIKEYIKAGDAMQVVLSQRMSAPFHARPLDVYRALRSLNPSPYLFYLTLNDLQIVGSSPEILVQKEKNEIIVRPIAGTRRRGKTIQEDYDLEKELLSDPKELAEHIMLVDLGRNDIGKMAKTGSVEVEEYMAIEHYSHVMHIVSQVKGKLKSDKHAIDALVAAFPAGTLSGAPKIRAMQIIQELEPIKRNVYGGAVGYIGWHDDMDMAIAIRTAVIKDKQLHIQAGAGIVADSNALNEWEETLNKGRAVFKAVSHAATGIM